MQTFSPLLLNYSPKNNCFIYHPDLADQQIAAWSPTDPQSRQRQCIRPDQPHDRVRCVGHAKRRVLARTVTDRNRTAAQRQPRPDAEQLCGIPGERHGRRQRGAGGRRVRGQHFGGQHCGQVRGVINKWKRQFCNVFFWFGLLSTDAEPCRWATKFWPSTTR